MAKPPRKTSVTTTPPTSPASRPVASAEVIPAPITISHVVGAAHAHSSTSSAQPTSTSSGGANVQSAVVVTAIADPSRARTLGAISATNWPKDKIHELRPVSSDSGLFEGFDGQIYAFVGDRDYMWVERRANGEYRSPLVTRPGAELSFRKLEGEARWHADWLPSQPVPDPDVTRNDARPKPLGFIPPFLAATLTSREHSAQGLRYDAANRPYVDTLEGTIMIHRHPDGSYQQKSADRFIPTGPMVEQMAGQKIWRFIQNAEEGQASSQHSASTDGTSVDAIAQPGTRAHGSERPQPLTNEQWINWGKENKPETGESIAINGRHYPIVPVGNQTNDATRVYFLSHPDFSPSHFETFERMLREAPALQPVQIWRSTDTPLKVRVGETSFTQPLTQSVRDMFSEFSDITARAVARMLFERADNSRTITSAGLLKLQWITDQWRRKPLGAASSFADPVDMLPVAPRAQIGGRTTVLLPPEVDGPLQRLTFDPLRFHEEWTKYRSNSTFASLRLLVSGVLRRCGYEVAPFTRFQDWSSLVFQGSNRDKVYFMKVGQVTGNAFALGHSPEAEFADPHLRARIGDPAYTALMQARTEDKIVWLQGGVLSDGLGRYCVFIIREA